ncbi:MAG: heme ABC transporter ATP-binding protein [Pseudomonadota bacterium]
MFVARDVDVTLGKTSVLRGVNFQARAGEITAIVGPNGSGKTTLLRAMTGDIAFSGTVEMAGRSIREAPGWWLAERRAVLAQSARLAFPFTVYEVVRLGLSASTAPDERRIDAALERVGLGGFAGRFYHELSGGEQQRVQLARVLVQVWEPVALDGDPAWLFLDEPVSALDIGHQLEVMEVARDFAQRGGGVVAVMHDLNLTAMYAASVALLTEGRLVGQDTPAAIMTDAQLSKAYGCTVRVGVAPAGGIPFILPQMAQPQ